MAKIVTVIGDRGEGLQAFGLESVEVVGKKVSDIELTISNIRQRAQHIEYIIEFAESVGTNISNHTLRNLLAYSGDPDHTPDFDLVIEEDVIVVCPRGRLYDIIGDYAAKGSGIIVLYDDISYDNPVIVDMPSLEIIG